MRADIIQHKFIEFGKHRGTTDHGKMVQHLYGIKAASVADVINDGFVSILDVHPQVGMGIGRLVGNGHQERASGKGIRKGHQERE